MNLEDFVASHTPYRRECKTCVHPLRAQIEAGRQAGISFGVIAAWLQAENKPIQATTLYNHFQNNHHLREDYQSAPSTNSPNNGNAIRKSRNSSVRSSGHSKTSPRSSGAKQDSSTQSTELPKKPL